MSLGATLSPGRDVLRRAPRPPAAPAIMDVRLDRAGPGSGTPTRLAFLVLALALIAVGIGA